MMCQSGACSVHNLHFSAAKATVSLKVAQHEVSQ